MRVNAGMQNSELETRGRKSVFFSLVTTFVAERVAINISPNIPLRRHSALFSFGESSRPMPWARPLGGKVMQDLRTRLTTAAINSRSTICERRLSNC